ncbi:MAG TPA: DUF2630 family protein [Gemmatimonadota bacterium]|jgi:hypothetical protein
MNRRGTDRSVRERIQELVEEEHRLYEEGAMDAADQRRLADVEIELDQCWDLLRQRRAAREMGQDPSQARVRPAEVVENYQQ